MKHLDITVTGKVQGVFFRAATRDKAQALKVKGRVRNESDGSVFVEAEADDGPLEDFLDWLRLGPPDARVLEVKAVEGAMKGYQVFEIV